MPNDDSFPVGKLNATFSSTRCKYWDHRTYFSHATPPLWRRQRNRERVVNRQLSPWRIRYSQRRNGEGRIRNGWARSRAAAALVRLRPPSIRIRGRGQTSGGGEATARVGEEPLNDPGWRNPYAAPGHIADIRCPTFSYKRRGASSPGWRRPR